MSKYYEIFVFTASLKEYANPVIDILDKFKTVKKRLFREHCSNYSGMLIKDMTTMNRELSNIILIDNSEVSFLYQPENALHIKSYFDQDTDTELYRLMPFLAFSSQLKDTRPAATNWNYFENTSDDVIEYTTKNNQPAFVSKV